MMIGDFHARPASPMQLSRRQRTTYTETQIPAGATERVSLPFPEEGIDAFLSTKIAGYPSAGYNAYLGGINLF
jgi:hypothetical protein